MDGPYHDTIASVSQDQELRISADSPKPKSREKCVVAPVAVSPLINLETQHDGRSARIG